MLPSLLFFVLLPWLLPRLGFYASMLLACAATATGYVVMAAALARAGIRL